MFLGFAADRALNREISQCFNGNLRQIFLQGSSRDVRSPSGRWRVLALHPNLLRRCNNAGGMKKHYRRRATANRMSILRYAAGGTAILLFSERVFDVGRWPKKQLCWRALAMKG